MFRKDYILTMIEQLGYFLARIRFLKQTQRGDVARIEINDFCEKYFGHGTDALRAMSHAETVALCTEDGELVIKRAIALGMLFKEMGDLDLQDTQAGLLPCEAYNSALLLLLLAYGDGTRALPPEAVERLEIAIERSSLCELHADVALLLARFFEHHGSYAEAEDLLFELVEGAEPGAFEEAVAFYGRLGALSDAELESGGLPRDEVEEGLQGLLGRRG